VELREQVHGKEGNMKTPPPPPDPSLTWAFPAEYFAHRAPEWEKKSDVAYATDSILAVVRRLDRPRAIEPHLLYAELHSATATEPFLHTERPDAGPILLYAVNAQLAVFPSWLRPKHGPVLVVLETWSDGRIVARWPEGRLYGEGSCDADAIRDLADNMTDFVTDIVQIRKKHKLAGAALEQWNAVAAMFDILSNAEEGS
jgi:hypothetical protein